MWEMLRRVRNSCASGLTRSQAEVTPEQQKVYRWSYSENVRHYLYLDAGDLVVAYSRLEWRDGFMYPSCGVAEWARGMGYAWDVVKHAMLASGGPMRGELLDSNEAIKKVDYALGWRPVGPAQFGAVEVEAAWPPPFVEDRV
jgi:hypothetical protein